MPYTINKTDGGVVTTVADQTINTDTPVNLVGRGSVNYGEAFGESLVHITENFANSTAPTNNPFTGMLWYDTVAGVLKVNVGTPSSPTWNMVGRMHVATTAPASPAVGQTWFDTTTSIISVWNGSSWTAARASQLATARTIQLSGDVTGSASFDGSANINITTTLAAASAFRGALVLLASDTSLPDNASSSVKLQWTNTGGYDTDGFFSSSNNTRLTVPAGVTRVKVSTQLTNIFYSGADPIRFVIYKNGTGSYPGRASEGDIYSGHCSTAVINVASGDYFEIDASTSGSNLTTVSSTNGRTWFNIEVIE